MTDQLDNRLDSAGRRPTDDVRVRIALHALVEDRAASARVRPRRRLAPAVTIGLTLGVLGTGAAAASQWAPWTYVTEPDIVFSREWFDVEGRALGSCETHLATDSLSGDERTAAQTYLKTLDVDSLQPDPGFIAGRLLAVGRPDDLGRLIAGADIEDFNVHTDGEVWTGPIASDARILQDGLTQVVFNSLMADLVTQWPDLVNTLQSTAETQCSTDALSADPDSR